MNGKQRGIAKISIPPTHTIRQAMEAITQAPRGDASAPAGLALIVDRGRHLLGIATDGDIRRAIERGATLETSIARAMNARPFVIRGAKPNAEILAEVLEKIKQERWRKDKIRNVILVDEKKRVIDVISFFDLWRNSEIKFKHIGVVGLGYVGLTLALTLADHGFQVRGVEVDAKVRSALRRGKAHFYESGLHELLRDNLGRNFEVLDAFQPGDECDLYILAVGTPVDRANEPSFASLMRASRAIGKMLKQGDGVILRSTVPVGTTRSVVIPILEKASRLKAGRDFYVAFAPERTVEGKALEELRRLPQVIGGIDRVSSEVAAHIFNAFTSYSIIMDTLEEAEMVKLVNNTFRDVTFAFANELALVCRRWKINTAKVIEAANRDYSRSLVPMPSPGVGGYCLKKDPYIYIASAKKKGITPVLAARAREVSGEMVTLLSEEIIEFLNREKRPAGGAKVALIGFAFKGEPVTSDVRGSTAIDLAHALKRRVRRTVSFDPAVNPNDIRAHGVTPAKSAAEAVSLADVVIVMNNNPAFASLPMRKLLSRARRPALLIDAWGLYPAEEIAKIDGVEYRTL